MLYTFRAIDSVTGHDGCPGHTEPADDSAEHFSVNCGRCEPHLRRQGGLWFESPDLVPLTRDEQAEAKRLERENHRNQAMMAEAFGMALPELMKQHAAASQAPAPAAPRRRTARKAG